jgi:mannose-6-phosphate isomerase-like protein (cupin superfamily)
MLIRALEDCDEFVAGDDSLLRELLHPDKQEIAVRYILARALVAPGVTTLVHRLRASEVYYVVAGEGVMSIDDEKSPVRPGSAIYIPPGSTQFIQNTGATDLEFLCIVDPAWRKENEEVL